MQHKYWATNILDAIFRFCFADENICKQSQADFMLSKTKKLEVFHSWMNQWRIIRVNDSISDLFLKELLELMNG